MKIAPEWNVHLEIISRIQATENSKQYLLLLTDILQKTVVIFLILVLDIFISFIYLNTYLKTFFLTADENGAHQASIDIGAI